MVTRIDTTINPNITEVSPDYQENLKSFIDNIKICPANCRRKEYIKIYHDNNSTLNNYKLCDLVWLWDPTTPVVYSKKNSMQDVLAYIIFLKLEINIHIHYIIIKLIYQQMQWPTHNVGNQPYYPGKASLGKKILTISELMSLI